MESTQWYYSRGGTAEGPVNAADLVVMRQHGELRDDDFVWREGMADWARLAEMWSHIQQDGAGTIEAAVADMDQSVDWNQEVPRSSIPGPRTEYGYAPLYPSAGHAAVAAGAFAGFWLRFVAWFLDMLVLFAISCVLGCFAAPLLIPLGGFDPEAPPGAGTGLELLMNAISFVVGLIYYAAFETSSLQATPGKYVLRLQVTDINGGRVSFGRALARNLLKLLSGLILLIGYIMAAFTARKQALHDIICDCLVVRR